MQESRFDFRGGLNRSYSPDVVDQTEFWKAQNLELIRYGGLAKRPGTKRVHVTALPAAVRSLHHWVGPAGSQIVAIAGNRMYAKLDADANFAEVTDDVGASVAMDATARATFTQHTQFGAAELFAADGSLWKFDGTDLYSVAGAHAGTKLIEVYKSRLYANDLTKTVYWSAVSLPEEWNSINDAGQANAETYDELGITAMKTVGGSLLLFKPNSIARFTGVSTDDIRLDQQTEGVSADVGSMVQGGVVRMEEAVFFLSDRGPYLGSEAGIQPIGQKVEPIFVVDALADWQDVSIVHHKGRRQIHVAMPDGTLWAYEYRTGSWTGPHVYPWTTKCLTDYEKADGTESILFGGSDGFVREQVPGEDMVKDDVLRDGTGGEAVEIALEIRDIVFQAPQVFKNAHGSQEVSADLGEGGRLLVTTSGDQCLSRTVAIPTRGDGTNQYRFRPAWRGRRLTLTLEETTDYHVEIYGMVLNADAGRVNV